MTQQPPQQSRSKFWDKFLVIAVYMVAIAVVLSRNTTIAQFLVLDSLELAVYLGGGLVVGFLIALIDARDRKSTEQDQQDP